VLEKNESKIDRIARRGKQRVDNWCEGAETDDGSPRSIHDPEHYKYHVPNERNHSKSD